MTSGVFVVHRPQGPEGPVAGFGTGHREQLAKLLVGGILLHGAEGRQGEDAEGRLVAGDLAQRLGRLAAIEEGQRLGRVETDLGVRRGEPLSSVSTASGADRLQLKRRVGRQWPDRAAAAARWSMRCIRSVADSFSGTARTT